MKKKYFLAVVFQAIAPLLLLAFSVVVTQTAGVESQGAFAAAKSWFDLLIIIGCFGFPQSSILAINKSGASPKWLYCTTALYSFFLIPLFTAASFLLQKSITPTAFLALAAAVGAAAAVLANIWRGILLTQEDGFRFHTITVLPTLSFLTAAVVGILSGRDLKVDTAFFFGTSAAILLPLAYWTFPFRLLSGDFFPAPKVSTLISNGMEIFVQAISNVFQMFFCLWLLKKEFDLRQVGYFSMCLMLVNAVAFPLQAVSPIILNKWSKNSNGHALRAGARAVNFLLILLFLGVIIGGWGISLALDRFSGSKLQAMFPAMSIAAFVLIPMISLRIDGLRLSAAGDLRFNSALALGKCILFAMTISSAAFLFDTKDGAKLAMISWLLAEVTAATFCRLRVRKTLKTI